MAYVPLGNPIWSCQYRLQGGPRLMFRAGIYGLLAAGLIMLYARVNRIGLTVAAGVALRWLAWAQVVVTVLGGAGAITRALIRDYTTKMIESYRVSPMNSFTIVTGYMFGGTLQILLLYGVGLALGLALSVIGGTSSKDWLIGNLYLVVASASIWSIALFAGVGSGKPGSLTALLVIGGFVSPVLMSFVPGLALFLGVYAVGGCQRQMLLGLTGAGGSAFGIALTASVLMMAFWSVAAARRYRKPHLPALSVVGSLTLLALWLAFSLVGIVMVGDLVPAGWKLNDAPQVVLVVTLLGPLLVAHLPAASAVQMRRRHIMGAQPHLRSDGWSPALAAVLSMLLVCAMIVVMLWTGPTDQSKAWSAYGLSAKYWGVVVAALVLSVWTVTGMLRLSQFTIGRTVIASLIVVVLWAVPPMIDHLRVMFAVGPDIKAEDYSFLMGSSPVFSIIAACAWPAYAVGPGLVVQLVIALVATLLGNRAERIFIRKRARTCTDTGI